MFKLRALVVEIGFIAGLGIDVLPLNPPPKGDSLGSYLQFTNRYLCRSGFGSAQPPLSAFSFQLFPAPSKGGLSWLVLTIYQSLPLSLRFRLRTTSAFSFQLFPAPSKGGLSWLVLTIYQSLPLSLRFRLRSTSAFRFQPSAFSSFQLTKSPLSEAFFLLKNQGIWWYIWQNL